MSLDNGEKRRTAKKRGRKPKNYKEEYVLNKDQSKFFVDLSRDKKELDHVMNLLLKANDKRFGKEIIFKDIVLFALRKISVKDIEKIKEESLSEMEKVNRLLSEFNEKNKLNLELGEFLVKQLKIS